MDQKQYSTLLDAVGNVRDLANNVELKCPCEYPSQMVVSFIAEQ